MPTRPTATESDSRSEPTARLLSSLSHEEAARSVLSISTPSGAKSDLAAGLVVEVTGSLSADGTYVVANTIKTH